MNGTETDDPDPTDSVALDTDLVDDSSSCRCLLSWH